ncbi:hypothetical protein RJ53_01505 [Methanocalculus chunghsingensis]|uniref:Uncharacterized protein n=1 Tax=Methanocalculus chunghsingensis TaxID=156457 RepID=A0A8J7W8N2_9EURY|nr:hypothetical protein [Methanocalculus chunghsingensis]MBR1368238.1 hypothetical protein [Methanocalculus chunghsingensis]
MGNTSLEQDLQSEIRELPLHYQKKILDIVRLMKIGCRTTIKKHDILELKGCGKDLWKGTDAKEYVKKLRNEWD